MPDQVDGRKAERGGKYGGLPVWWAPPVVQEAALSVLEGTDLPPEIDFDSGTWTPEPGCGRWKQCCSVGGWLDIDTVLFESRHEDARVLAWRVGTPDVYRVSDVRGWTPGEESYVASFAALRG